MWRNVFYDSLVSTVFSLFYNIYRVDHPAENQALTHNACRQKGARTYCKILNITHLHSTHKSQLTGSGRR